MTNVYTNGSTVYTVIVTPPKQSALGNICVSQNGWLWIQNASANLTSSGTLAFVIGYLPQKGWFQTTAGNV